MNFIDALFQYDFLQRALIAGVLAAIGCGLVGTYVVVRRISFVAGGIAHAVLGGMGAALFFGYAPYGGAIVAALIAAVIIGGVSLVWKEREDTVIGALWAIGMAVGILFISATPGYQLDLFSYLFGNILMVSGEHLQLMIVLDVFLVLMVVLFHNQFNAVIFDEEFARLRGLPVTLVYLLLLAMVALTVVLLIQVVGLILVIALLTLPAAVAGHYTKTLSAMMLLAVLIGFLVTSSGMAVSYAYDLPSGATMILVAAIIYLVSALAAMLHRRKVRRV
ncbi:metal ABC transporter permease [Solemya velum gill symbiont]|uniref:ABC-type Mn2 /Zn2 transporter ZnuBCA, subunit B n=1 Tax=Solemya velum gill symbiont TaxID=2340 RepID=A0A0B0H7V4_SOVGS|nr:metal ABC transporter permease [Solemya velum gill symbiont]KHF25195.1 ABC-type Mn2 /Zn2 transporter ZnuBCA, subunit B [Solemya velum gill symbiont]OOY34132.1 hypothetical protein BOV88_11555 [Solemya velum gill symbiont]OOY36830.1 hypothetical protein BOV89_10465 [Solemya velum gill symbiont]OOY44784.1 hypothetical protein BOV92_07925 [Solemya velum gill symbiont]OOY46422.1 hypothetical protein BOV93_10130 [Solemya velum gill symbiont]